ncbi:hypothetical protein BFJ69_g15742 [Fusarium oxysporum]|uniref:Phosphoinositide phospholipase C n=1 Tax=Fusarium oxysporum TaxID=5507 RepID=A0A420MDB9_FUSOX|nr:hypothetical protein BFJ69_g15742 [Fusarium oxysporum]
MDLMSLTARDLANKCLEAFQICLTFHSIDPSLSNQNAPHDERFEYRLADFNLWIDGIGALAPSKASLDARLSERPIDLSLVKGNLVMLFQSLEDCLDLLKDNGSLEDALLDIDSALESLVTLSLAIRRTGRRSRLHKADRLFNPEEHAELRKHLEAIVLLRPDPGPCCPSDEFRTKMKSLTPLQNHLITANLKRRNRFIQAQLHSLGLKKRSVGFELPAPEAAQQAPSSVPSSSKVVGEITVPITSDATEQGHKMIQAPIKHLAEDIRPYTCIFDRCPAPDVYYSSRSMLEQHFRQDHPPVWVCPMCDHGSVYSTMSEMMDHLLGTHTQDIGEDISSIISSSAQTRMGIECCPLCEVKGDIDSPELIDHVLEHVHDFSLRSLPWPRSSEIDIGGEVGSFSPQRGEDAVIIGWLDGYEHETHDIDPTLELTTCDYGRLAIITELTRSEGEDKLGLDIDFADEHGDETADAETDISKLTQDTLDSLRRADGDREVVYCYECGADWYRDEKGLTCPECSGEMTEIVDTENDPRDQTKRSPASLSPQPTSSTSDHEIVGQDGIHNGNEIPSPHKPVSGFRRLTDRLFSRKKANKIEPHQDQDATKNLTQFLGLKEMAVENQKAWKILISIYHRRLDSPKKTHSMFVLYFGYRSIDLDVWNGTTDAEQRDPGVEQPREAKPGQTVKTLNRLFGLNRENNAQKPGDPKTTVSQSGHMSSPAEPIVTDGFTLMTPCGFREACQVIRKSAFVSTDLPLIINLEVHADSAQQEILVKIMKEEWHGILVDEPLEGWDPRFRLPTLEDLRGRILITLGTITSPSVSNSGQSDIDLHGESHHRLGRIPIIQPLADLGVYLRREKFEGFTDMRTKSPNHLFSMREGKVQELISTSHTKLFRHNYNYFFRVYPNAARQDSSNLDPLRFWRYGIQMAGIVRHNVDEGMMLNEGMFADESGWVLKPDGYRSSNKGTANDLAASPWKSLDLSIFVFRGQEFVTSTGREIKDLSLYMKALLHINDVESARIRSQYPESTEVESGALGYNLNFLDRRTEATIIPKLCILR